MGRRKAIGRGISRACAGKNQIPSEPVLINLCLLCLTVSAAIAVGRVSIVVFDVRETGFL